MLSAHHSEHSVNQSNVLDGTNMDGWNSDDRNDENVQNNERSRQQSRTPQIDISRVDTSK